jgi:CheY-like chemotaxis protein
LQAIIADDDPVVRHILASILKSLGVKISSVGSGKECLAALRDLPPAAEPRLLFLDVMLGDMTGIDVLAELRGFIRSDELAVVMVSANSKQEVLGYEPPFEPEFFLEKPFSLETVQPIVQAVWVSPAQV